MNHRKLAVSLAASLLSASSAMAAALPDASQARIATDYSTWAGGRDNAEALVSGLHRGTSITLSTKDSASDVSLAGFTPHGPMSYADVNDALARARADLDAPRRAPSHRRADPGRAHRRRRAPVERPHARSARQRVRAGRQQLRRAVKIP